MAYSFTLILKIPTGNFKGPQSKRWTNAIKSQSHSVFLAKILLFQPIPWCVSCSWYAISGELLWAFKLILLCVGNTHLYYILSVALWLEHSSWRPGLLIWAQGSVWSKGAQCQNLSAINHHVINKDDVMILFTPWSAKPGQISLVQASWKAF